MRRFSYIRMLLGVVLTLTMLPAGAAASQAPGGLRKLLVDSADRTAIAAVARAGGALLADYGSFALWSVAETAARPLLGRSTVVARDDFDTIFLRQGSLDTRRGQPPLPAGLQQVRSAAPQLWMVQFVGPIKDDWLATLRSTGARLVSYLPNNAYVVWADGRALARIEALVGAGKTLQWSGAYHPAYRLAPALLAQTESGRGEALLDVTVQFYTTAASDRSLAALRALGGQVHKQPERILDFTNISLQLPAGALSGLAHQADVFNIEPWSAPRKLDERQNQIIAGNITTTVDGKVVPDGVGYLAWLAAVGLPSDPGFYPIVDVVDDGVDNGTTTPLHPDFYQLGLTSNQSRIVAAENCTTDALADGIGGHGNLNTGIVGGYNNQPTGAPYTDADGFHYGLGVAPYSRLANTKIFRNSGSYSVINCGGTDQGVVEAGYNAGAAITSNSWGCGPSGGCRGSPYDVSAQAYDALTRDASAATPGNQQMTHIFAAGNDGAGAQTLGSPGTAKNVITVGATENVREDGVVDGCGESSNDNADDVVGFSSRGPTDDGRAKPDIMAPGSHIQGLASQAPGYNGTGVCDTYHPAGQTLYTWSTGTSHSTPAVAGAAALLYAFYRQHVGGGVPPSPAMLKAYLLNSARFLTGDGANDTLPSNVQGFGDVYLKMAFDDALKRFYDQQRTFGDSGEQEVIFGQAIDSNKPLAITLAWTDAPGSTTADAYVNNLDLEVTIGGQTYFGNHFGVGGFSSAGGTADTRNNVEKIVLPAGVSGNFAVRVIARNIAGDGVPGNADSTDQDFALAIYNGSAGPVGALQGSVEHASGTPIPGALVATDQGFSALTDETGAYTLRLPADTYTVTASISGYSVQTVENIAITANVTTTQDFVLAGGAIQGRVVDAFTPAQPIAGAVVGTGEYSATTDAEGNYFIPRVPVGSHTLTAVRTGYMAVSAPVVVADDAVAIQDFVLPGGALAGMVSDASSGLPLPGATVGISGNPPAITDVDGRYWARVPPGSYDLTISKVGYAIGSVSGIDVTSGVTTTYDAQLTPNLGFGSGTLSKTLAFGQTITDTPGLTLTNNASVPMTVTIVEQSGGFVPLAAGNDILLVNRNASAANTAAAAALTNLGYSFDAVDNTAFESYDLATLANYRAVVYVGNTGVSPDSASNTKLIEYLDDGGRLLISDNDLGYFNHGSAFYDTYLDATYGGDDPGPGNRNLIGEDIMSGVDPPSSDSFPDYFTTGANSVAIFRYPNSAIGGARVVGDTYRAVYLASDFDRLGTTATGEPIEAAVMQRGLAWLLGGDEIPWLEQHPTTVTVPAGQDVPIDIGWHAEHVPQPGTYTATLRLRNTLVPTLTDSIAATMVVSPTGTQGKLTGVVSSTGVCDTSPGPVAGAHVDIQGTGGFSATLTTDAAGAYSYWLDAGTYSLSVDASDQSSASASVDITPGATANQDFLLRLQAPCIAAAPTSLSAELLVGEQVTRTLVITSAGALPLDYSLLESAGALAPAPDAAGYLWAEQPAEWIDTSAGAENNPLDDGEFDVTLPFTFPFYGVVVTQLRVGNNGGALLGTATGDVPFSNTAMDAPTTPNYFLAPFWDDLTSQSGGVYVQTVGAAPNRKMVVEWRDRPHYNGIGAATFQMVLYEGGSILFQYQDVDFGSSAFDGGASATVGIRGPDAANSSQFSLNSTALANGRAVCFVRPGAPACGDLPWLATTPAEGKGLIGDPPSTQQVDVTLDAGAIDQPGVYTATLAIVHNAPQPSLRLPVTMTVGLPAGWGLIDGSVVGLGPCDTPGAPLAGVPVQLDATAPLTLTTDANGEFSAALPDGFYSLTVSATGYLSQTVGVTVTTGLTTTADIALRLYAPCQNVAPAALSASLPPGQIVTRTLAISNTGAADLAWELEERIPPSQVPAVVGGNTARARPVATPRQASRASIVPLADVVLDGSFEATAGGTYENPYWQQGSTNYGTVLCTLDSPPNGCGSGAGTVGPHSGSWFVWFGGIEPSFPTEHGYVSQDVLLQPGIGTLSFWLRIGASSGRADDTMRVLIDNTEIFSVTAQSTEYSNYQQVTLPISSFADGLTHTLRLESTVLTGGNTNFSVDDVVLDVASVPCDGDALPWVAVTPASGTAPAAGASLVDVAFSSVGLSNGVYTGTLCLSSNDLLLPQLSIPLTLTVETLNATGGVTIAQSGGGTAVTEGGATDSYTLVLDSPPNTDVTISFDVGIQIEPIAPLIFTPSNWNVPQTATVGAIDDMAAEGAHTATIAHQASSADARYNGAALSIPSITVAIADNDTAPSPLHSLFLPILVRQPFRS